MRHFLIFLFFLICLPVLSGQNCYVQLGDVSGFNTQSYQNGLEAAACSLRATLPDSLQPHFKVFDSGLYLHQGAFFVQSTLLHQDFVYFVQRFFERLQHFDRSRMRLLFLDPWQYCEL